MATLTEITKGLEASVLAVGQKKAALDNAKAAVASAEVAYQAVIENIKKLHAEYEAIMKDILTLGGTIHR